MSAQIHTRERSSSAPSPANQFTPSLPRCHYVISASLPPPPRTQIYTRAPGGDSVPCGYVHLSSTGGGSPVPVLVVLPPDYPMLFSVAAQLRYATTGPWHV